MLWHLWACCASFVVGAVEATVAAFNPLCKHGNVESGCSVVCPHCRHLCSMHLPRCREPVPIHDGTRHWECQCGKMKT